MSLYVRDVSFCRFWSPQDEIKSPVGMKAGPRALEEAWDAGEHTEPATKATEGKISPLNSLFSTLILKHR
jgi:hypothetical protein